MPKETKELLVGSQNRHLAILWALMAIRFFPKHGSIIDSLEIFLDKFNYY